MPDSSFSSYFWKYLGSEFKDSGPFGNLETKICRHALCHLKMNLASFAYKVTRISMAIFAGCSDLLYSMASLIFIGCTCLRQRKDCYRQYKSEHTFT